MVKNILHNLKSGTQLLLVALLLASCFVIDRGLFSGIIIAKSLWAQAITLVAIGSVAIQVLFVKQIKVKAIDILVSLLVLWMIARDGFNNLPHANPQEYLIQIALYFCLYIFFRLMGNNEQKIKGILTVYLLIVAAQAVIGLLQLYGVLSSHHALFKITGAFHNPGPFIGFLVSGLPMALGMYLTTRTAEKGEGKREQLTVNRDRLSVFSKQFWVDLQLNKVLSSEFQVGVNWDRLLNYFAQFVIIVLLLVLPAARSRAAWLGGVVGCLFVVLYHKEPLQKYTKSLNEKLSGSLRFNFVSSVITKRYAVPLAIILFGVTLFGLYKYKQGSADGRLLMWQVSWEMIKDKPLLGYGQGGFEANYANYQAEWFKSGKGTEAQEMVAGSPNAPFNELIRVAINYGMVGVVGVFALLIGLFRREPQRTTEDHEESLRCSVLPLRFSAILKAGLISILVFSLFSYPLDVIPVLIQFILLAAILVNQYTEHRTLNTEYLIPRLASAILLITIIPFATINIGNNYRGLKHWQEANELYQYELYSDASEKFELAKKYLPKEGILLQMQAKCYTMFKRWDKAINTAHIAQDYKSGQILNIVLGDAYKAIERFEDSEFAYKQASYMMPHKFFPKYLLAKMYDESGQRDKAVKLANVLLNKEIKVESTAIQEMRSELMNIINAREKEQEAAESQNVALPVSLPFQRKKGGL